MSNLREEAGNLLPQNEAYYSVSDKTAKLAEAMHRVDVVRLALKESNVLSYQLGEAFDQLLLDLETAVSSNIRATLRTECRL